MLQLFENIEISFNTKKTIVEDNVKHIPVVCSIKKIFVTIIMQIPCSGSHLMKQFCNKEDKFYSIFSLGPKLNYVLWLVDMFDSDQRKNLVEDYSHLALAYLQMIQCF